MRNFYREICEAVNHSRKLLAVLVDPDKFDETQAVIFLDKLPRQTTHILVGGSTAEAVKTAKTVKALKAESGLPIILFPGDYSQITQTADALLFLSLISGRNPEYLIEQQVKSVKMLQGLKLQIIPTGYLLIDGGNESAVQRVSETQPILQNQIEKIVHTALAGQFLGQKLIYLEAGSGARFPVSEEIISEVKMVLDIPLIIGGGIRTAQQLKKAYQAGADMVVMGTAFEDSPGLS